MKRPMLYWVLLFVLGEVSGKLFPISIISMLAVGMVAVFCVVPSAFFMQNRKLHVIGIMFFVTGVLCFSYANQKLSLLKAKEGDVVEFYGRVTEFLRSEEGTDYIIKSKMMNGTPLSAKIQISTEEEMEFVLGSTVFGHGSVKLFSKATNPGEFDKESYQIENGIFLNLKKVSILDVRAPKVPVYEYLYRIRKKLISVYEQTFDEQNASLAGAMVLGDKASLDPDIKQLYQRNGIAHLIAISGLHIAMIGGVIYQALRKLFGSYLMAAALGGAFIILYGLMTGLSGATCRAVIMLMVAFGADVAGRRYDPITAVVVALFILLIKNPFQITQAGFLLSFGAMIGISVLNPVWKMLYPKLPVWLEGFFVSLSVQMVLLPILLYYFYEVPIYGILLNLIVVPLMSILLALLICCGIFGSLFLPAGILFAKIANIIFYLYEILCKLSEGLPFHTLCTGRPSFIWIFLYYMVLICFLIAGYQKKRKDIFFLTGIYFGMFLVFLIPSSLKVCVFDVGQGDGIYVRTMHRKHILIDGGSSSKKKVGAYVLKNGMKFYGGNEIDYLFVSHLDSDHYNGVAELLSDKTVRIKNLFLPDIANPDAEYKELEKIAKEKGCRIYHLKRNDSLMLDGVTFKCLNPLPKVYEDKNQGSLVLLMTYRNFDMLFTGDMDEVVEKEMIHQINTPVEVLKVAHHGSGTSSSEDFLKKLTPDISCISVGERNHYGHPAGEVIKRLNVYCKKIYLTKDSGAITIETNGKTYRSHSYGNEEDNMPK